jgi:glycosyltransferase involved in cell wall biosynthesis
MPKVWHGLARAFIREGHRVTILARKFPGQPDEEREGNLSILRMRGFSQSANVARDLAKDLMYTINVLPRLPSADILVTNDFWVPALAPTARRSAGAVVVCAARFPKGQYWLYSRAAKVVAISTAVRKAIVGEQPLLGPKTVVIPLPVDVDAFAFDGDSRAPQKRTLLYVGRVHPEKGIDLLLHAFVSIANRCPDWRLKIVGPVDEADGGGGTLFGDSLHALGRGFDVVFSGPIFEQEALAREYRDAALFCYPSLADRGEAFGLAPLEAMAAGVPAIVSALDCFADFICNGENGWVFDHRAENPEERLADTLELAMNDAPARRRLGERARSDAGRFTYTAVAKRYLGEFERILAVR